MAAVAPQHSTVVKMPAPDQPEYNGGGGGVKSHLVASVALRVLLFVTSLICTVVMATSKQTEIVLVGPGLAVPVDAKLTISPALLYFIIANAVACFYSIITGLLSVLALINPKHSSAKPLFLFVVFDTVLLSIMASATGAAGAVAYIGLKGNSHTRWNKICNVFGTFCGHVGSSTVVSLIPSLSLLLLVWISVSMIIKNGSRR